MDLRNAKRKRSDHEQTEDEIDFRSFSKDRSLISASDDDSYHSCISYNHSLSTTNQLNESILEPQSFLEGKESQDFINIPLDSKNPVIMPQEVVVYGYENASFNKKPNKSVFPPCLNSNMSKLHISPQKNTGYQVSQDTECLSSHDYEIPEISKTSSPSGDKLFKSLENDFLGFRRNTNDFQIPPCTQTSRHKIDRISKYVLTPNFRSGYISNLQFNMPSKMTRGFGMIRSILPEEQPQFSFVKPNSPQIAQTSLNLNHQISNSEMDISQDSKRQFICSLCTISFGALSTYLTHLRAHINIGTLFCEICHDQLSDTSEIRDHITIHAQMEVFLCEYCCMTFSSIRHLKCHLLNSVKGVHFSCLSCSLKFCCKRGLVQHKQFHYSRHYLCNECHFKSFRSNLIHDHLKSLHNIEYARVGHHFQIYIPNSAVNTKYKLRNSKILRANQLQKHYPNLRKTIFVPKIKCQHCFRVFTTKSSLYQHNLHRKCLKETTINSLPIDISNVDSNVLDSSKDTDTSGEISEKCVCPHCSNVFKRVAYLNQHILNRVCLKHLPPNSLTSDIGDVNDDLHNPSIDLDDNEDNIIQNVHICTNCNVVFKSKKSLGNHIRNRICLKNLSSNPLINDIDDGNVHTSSRDLVIQNDPVCTNCHRIFKSRRSLRQHIHNRVCQKNLSSNSLTRDIEDVNEDLNNSSKDLEDNNIIQNDIVCANCHRIFKRKSYLNQHLLNRVCLKHLLSNSTTSNIDYVNDNLHSSSIDLDDHDVFQKEPMCTNCHRIFKKKAYLNQHVRNRVCQKVLSEFSLSIDRAKIAYGASSLKKLVCPYCEKEFKSRRNCKQHILYLKCQKRNLSNSLPTELEDPNTQLHISSSYTDNSSDIADTLLYPDPGGSSEEDSYHRNIHFISEKDFPTNSMSVDTDEVTSDLHSSSGVPNSSDYIPENYICEHCNLEFETVFCLNEHIRYCIIQKKMPSNSLQFEINDVTEHSSSHSNDLVSENNDLNLDHPEDSPNETSHKEGDEVSKEEHSCPRCSRVYSSRKNLMRHFNYITCRLPSDLRNTGINMYQICPHCNMVFDSKKSALYHISNTCGKFKPRKTLVSAIKTKLATASNYTCDNCAKSFKYISTLQNHVRNRDCASNSSQLNSSLVKYMTKLKGSPFTCKRCQITLSSKDALLRHNRRKQCSLTTDSNNHKAPKYRNFTKDSKYAKPSTQIENLERDGPKLLTDTQHYACLHCKEKFLNRNLFKNHIQVSTCVAKSFLHHEGKNICSGCKSRFQTPANIRRHVSQNSCKFFNESHTNPE
ncbi:Zinc finger protein [Oopsacas minuta]|uniref:Zinc finger protein n=1 Tax=Oopsacas minuta TaxID=111878 RepID=A0AAV7JQ06_9METZ|nr:Zinc finger protein [Oopsacas minuta]